MPPIQYDEPWVDALIHPAAPAPTFRQVQDWTSGRSDPNTPTPVATPASTSTPATPIVDTSTPATPIVDTFMPATPPVLGADGYYYTYVNGQWVQGPKGADTRDTSAITDIQNVLGAVGLAGLATNAYQQWKNGVPVSEIMSNIQNSPEYAQRFPGMAALAKTGNRISEAEYIAKENQDRALLQEYGVSPTVFGSTADLGRLIVNNVSSSELQQRLIAAHDSVQSADPAVAQYLKDTYGLTQGDLASYFLDPAKTLQSIQTRANAGQLGGVARESGVNLTGDQATGLSQMGVDAKAARANFAKLGQMGQFQTNLPGDESDAMTQQQLLDATFAGNATALRQLDLLRQQRLAQFQQGGAYAADSKGITGLGVANTR